MALETDRKMFPACSFAKSSFQATRTALQGWCLHRAVGEGSVCVCVCVCVCSSRVPAVRLSLIWYRVFFFLHERGPCYNPSDLFSGLCRVGILWLPELEEVRGEIFFHKCLMWFYGLAGPFTSLSPQTCFVS